MTYLGGDLSLAELTRMVSIHGADPETVIFKVDGWTVQVGDLDLHREDGVLVVGLPMELGDA